MLFTNPAAADSVRGVHPAPATSVKSPASIFAVGTKLTVSGGFDLLDLPLVAAEEEQLVLEHRAAERPAELVALEAVARRREEVARVEVVVADELEGVAAERVGARTW